MRLKLRENILYKNILITFFILLVDILFSIALFEIKVRVENIYLFSILSILIISVETKKYIYPLISSFILTVALEFIFIKPEFSILITNPYEIISSVIFLAVCLITTLITTIIQKQIIESKFNEEKIEQLYKISNMFLTLKDTRKIYYFLIEKFKTQYNFELVIYDSLEEKIYGENKFNFIPENYKEEINYCLNQDIIIGKGMIKYDKLPFIMFPVVSDEKYGTFIIYGKELKRKDIEFIKNNIQQLLVTLDSEHNLEIQEKLEIDELKKRYKNNLLNIYSNDLKTPISTIDNKVNELLENKDNLEKDEVLKQLKEITIKLKDIIDLNNNLDKLLVQDNNIVNTEKELVEDLLKEIKFNYRRKLRGKKLKIEKKEVPYTLLVDKVYVIQLFNSLIDNAIEHTKKLTVIEINYNVDMEKNMINFIISDNGGGISYSKLKDINDLYFTEKNQKKIERKQYGAGLSFCNSIIKAHGGNISIENNEKNGVSVKFSLPLYINTNK